MKIRIAGTVYDVKAIDNLSLLQLLEVETQTEKMGRKITVGDVNRWAAEIEKMPEADRATSEHLGWVTAMTIYAARVLGGERISFADAIDVPMDQIDFLPEPKDHKKPDPTRARPASGPGGKPRQKPRGTKTSKTASTDASSS